MIIMIMKMFELGLSKTNLRANDSLGLTEVRKPVICMAVVDYRLMLAKPGMVVTRSFDQRPNSRGSHESGALTCPNMPNKEVSSGEGQRKQIYNVTWACWGKRRSKHFSLGLNGEKVGEGERGTHKPG
jgi:hypothetical protein